MKTWFVSCFCEHLDCENNNIFFLKRNEIWQTEEDFNIWVNSPTETKYDLHDVCITTQLMLTNMALAVFTK